VLPIATDPIAFSSQNSHPAAAAAAAPKAPALPCFTFQYEKIFIITTPDHHLCLSLSPKWQQPISALLLRTGLSDANAPSLAARHGSNEFIVEIPSFAEVCHALIRAAARFKPLTHLQLAKEHARAPFFVFQMFCCALWSFEDNFIYRFFV
jgi:cation-transporting ATPase 13A1